MSFETPVRQGYSEAADVAAMQSDEGFPLASIVPIGEPFPKVQGDGCLRFYDVKFPDSSAAIVVIVDRDDHTKGYEIVARSIDITADIDYLDHVEVMRFGQGSLIRGIGVAAGALSRTTPTKCTLSHILDHIEKLREMYPRPASPEVLDPKP
ncbi:hypothetical protein H7097_00255 [Aeromicrobium sp.]|nr:hypothetical protein [Candidatus Saccharibacteria bacterium]